MSFDEGFIVIDQDTGDPIPRMKYRIYRESGEVVEGVTNDRGRTTVIAADRAENLRIEVLEEDT